jgi:hypothetical protein
MGEIAQPVKRGGGCYMMAHKDEDELVANLVWRVKQVAELPAGVTREVDVARLERDEQAGLADLGLRFAEAKQLTARAAGRDGVDSGHCGG